MLQGKKQGEETVEHAETVARLQGQLAATQEKVKKADEEAVRLRECVEQMQDLLSSQATQLQAKVKAVLSTRAQKEQPQIVAINRHRSIADLAFAVAPLHHQAVCVRPLLSTSWPWHR